MAKTRLEISDGPKPPREVSHEEQFTPEGSNLDGWKSSEDPHEGCFVDCHEQRA